MKYLMFDARKAVLAVALTCVTGVAQSAIVYTTRLQARTVSFSDLSFNDAFQSQQNVLTGSGTVGDHFVYTDSSTLGTTGLSVSGGGGFGAAVVSPYADGPTNAVGQFSVDVVGPSTIGSVTFNSQRTLTSQVTGGRNVLDVTVNPFGYVQPGGTVDVSVVLPGDWSQIGNSMGQVQLLGINPAWSVTQAFFFNSVSNTTTFAARNGNYDGSASAGITMRLYGSQAVPLPAAAWLLLSGLGGLGAMSRRRGTAGSATSPSNA